VLLGRGNGSFATAVNYAAGEYPVRLAIGDMNGDQTPDLAVVNAGKAPEYKRNVSLLLGLGNGTFENAKHYIAGYFPNSIAISDVDDDQAPDLIVANGTAGAVTVLKGVGDGTVLAAAEHAVGDGPTAVAVSDLDADQVPDIVVANALDEGIAVLRGVGDGTFAEAARYPVYYGLRSIAIGDLDGDRVPDVALGGLSDVRVLLGLGDGTFGPAVGYYASASPQFIAIGDLDGDRVPDLVATNNTVNKISVLLGAGGGTFSSPVHFVVGYRPRSVAIGDLNGDEVPDLAVASEGIAGSVAGNVAILTGVGDGTYGTAIEYAAGDAPSSVAIGDLDGDDVPDLAVTNSESDNLSVLLGDGDGSFAAAVHYKVGTNPLRVLMGDLNLDRIPDLAVANGGELNRYAGHVSVLLGFGDGTFIPAQNYAADTASHSLAISDVDGDRMPDLVVTSYFQDSVSVLRNALSRDCNRNTIPDTCDIDCGPPGDPCNRPGCGQSEDCNDNGVPDECEADSDHDGLLDDCDACPRSDLAKLIVINDCETSVPNTLLENGCTMMDVLNGCMFAAHSHGEMTACAARHANEWRRQGLLSGKDVGRIVHCAGTSNERGPSKRVQDRGSRDRR